MYKHSRNRTQKKAIIPSYFLLIQQDFPQAECREREREREEKEGPQNREKIGPDRFWVALGRPRGAREPSDPQNSSKIVSQTF